MAERPFIWRQESILSQLLAAGVSPLIADRYGQQLPLHLAAAHGMPAAVELLLQAAPQAATAVDGFGLLPAHLAARQRAEGVVPLELLAAAAPATLAARAQNPTCLTPLHHAASSANNDVVRLLLRRAPETALAHSRAFPWDHENPWQPAQLPLKLALAGAMGRAIPGFLEATPTPMAYLETALLLLEATPPEAALPILTSAWQQQQLDPHQLLSPLHATLVACWPLSEAQWQRVPAPCPGLGRALPAVLQRSEAEAALLVAHLPAADRQRLQAFALALHRMQRQLGIDLPAGICLRILSLFDL